MLSSGRARALQAEPLDEDQLPQKLLVSNHDRVEKHLLWTQFSATLAALLIKMFQCIIQRNNGLIYNSAELKNVFPGRQNSAPFSLYFGEKFDCFDTFFDAKRLFFKGEVLAFMNKLTISALKLAF